MVVAKTLFSLSQQVPFG